MLNTDSCLCLPIPFFTFLIGSQFRSLDKTWFPRASCRTGWPMRGRWQSTRWGFWKSCKFPNFPIWHQFYFPPSHSWKADPTPREGPLGKSHMLEGVWILMTSLNEWSSLGGLPLDSLHEKDKPSASLSHGSGQTRQCSLLASVMGLCYMLPPPSQVILNGM